VAAAFSRRARDGRDSRDVNRGNRATLFVFKRTPYEIH
jgi:hypothetical protein